MFLIDLKGVHVESFQLKLGWEHIVLALCTILLSGDWMRDPPTPVTTFPQTVSWNKHPAPGALAAEKNPGIASEPKSAPTISQDDSSQAARIPVAIPKEANHLLSLRETLADYAMRIAGPSSVWQVAIVAPSSKMATKTAKQRKNVDYGYFLEEIIPQGDALTFQSNIVLRKCEPPFLMPIPCYAPRDERDTVVEFWRNQQR
jgi:hypothetical protein